MSYRSLLLPAVAGLAAATLAFGAVPVLRTADTAAAGGSVPADPFTMVGGPLADGQIEVATLSTRAATVTGGDVLVAVRGLAADDEVVVTAAGVEQSAAFAREADPYAPTEQAVGLVTGLPEGVSEVTATVTGATYGTRSATLEVTNHPLTGPVFSGPHQTPFVCRLDRMRDFDPEGGTRPAIVGDPANCHFETYERWYYLSTQDPEKVATVPAFEAPDQAPFDTWNWLELTDPFGEYPADMAYTVTTDGVVAPAIARVQTTAINRGMTRLAMLDDPAARGPETAFEMHEGYNGRFFYNWGASCGVGRSQGDNSPNEVLSGFVDAGGSAIDVGPEVVRPAVLQGYIVAHSSMTIFGNHCNQVLSAETFMMVREFVTEHVARHEWVTGNGASGGAIQQYTTMNMYPGLLDGALPLVSFPDVITTAMSPIDCRLLRRAFELSDGVNPSLGGEREVWTGQRWTIAKQNAITGHVAPGVCEDWDTQFSDLVVADTGCGRIPNHLRYVRRGAEPIEGRPAPGTGERCTLQDNLRHFMGVDPTTGYAPLPIDNVGVQYGLQALLDGVITVDEFLYLNRVVGGMDDEGYGPWAPAADGSVATDDGATIQPRMAMPAELAHDLYRYGFVTGRGALDQAPIIDVDLYADPVPILGFHDQVRSYMAGWRMEETYGDAENQAIWSGPVLTNDAWPVMHQWLDGIEAARAAAGGVSESWNDEVEATRPTQGDDSCVVTTGGYSPVPLGAPGTAGDRDQPCEQVFRPMGSPRIVAGGPDTEDIIKCQLKPVDLADYGDVTFTPAQQELLEAIFADGVCDYGVDGVGEVERSATWLHWGNADVVVDEPFEIPHVVARS